MTREGVGKLRKLQITQFLVTEKSEHLQHTVNEFESVCDSMGLKINVGMSKVLMIKKAELGTCEKVRVNGEEKHYLEVMISTDGDKGEEVAHSVLGGEERFGGRYEGVI